MSGSIGDITNSIQGADRWQQTAPQFNPLAMIQGYQNYQNSVAQNALIRSNTALTNTQNQSAQFNLGTNQSNRLLQTASTLLAAPAGTLTGSAGYALSNKILDQEAAQFPNDPVYQAKINAMRSTIPAPIRADGTPTPDSVYRTAATVHTAQLLAAANPDAAIRATVGSPGSISNGQAVQPGMIGGPIGQNPGGFTPTGQPIQQFPSRSELATQQQQTDTNEFMPDGKTPNPNFGRVVSVPLGNRLVSQGAGNLAGPAAGGGGPLQPGSMPPRLQPAPTAPQQGVMPVPGQPLPPVSQIAPNLAQPRVNPTGAVTPGAGPAGTAVLPNSQASPQAPGSTGVVTGFGAADQPAQVASGTQYAQDRADAGSYTQRIYPLSQATKLLASGVTTGPGSDYLNQVKSFVQARAQNIGLDPYKAATANYEETGKYLQQIVNANPMAQGSDARLAATLSGNPGTHISTLANQNVVKAALGLERMKQAAVLNYQGAPAGYADYLKNFSTTNDPRAYIADMLSSKQLKDTLTGMSPQERKQFNSSYDTAVRLGLMTNTAMPANQ